MKKIFLESHNIDNLYFGFGQFNYHLVKALANENHSFEITLHSSKVNELKKEFENKFNYKTYFSFRRHSLFRIKKKYDLWHSLNQNTKIEPFYQIPYLLTVHNISHIKDPKNYKHLENHKRFQEKINRSTAITYISKYAKESTHQFFDVPKIPEFIIYNGNTISDIQLPQSYKPLFKSKKPFLFTIGEITERKNFISLVRMMLFLPDYNLIIGGKKNTKAAEEIINLITQLQLENRIFLLGKISNQDRQYYYQNCDAFVFPSLREGFGLPVIEAMRFGKPVFISNNTSLPEIGGDSAFYWNHYNPEYMAQVFEEGMTVFENNKEILTAKYIQNSKKFNWKTSAKQYIEVYNLLLK